MNQLYAHIHNLPLALSLLSPSPTHGGHQERWAEPLCCRAGSHQLPTLHTLHTCQSCGRSQSLSCVRLFVTLWTVAHQAPLPMEFPRQEYWSGLSFPTPGDLPNPGIEPVSPASSAVQADSSPIAPPGKPQVVNPNLPICPTLSLPTVSTCPFSTSVSLFLPYKQVQLYHFSRFHIYALIYDICFFLSDLLYSVTQTLGPLTSLQMTHCHFFLWLTVHWIYVPHLYPFIWWTFKLLPCPGQYGEQYGGSLRN